FRPWLRGAESKPEPRDTLRTDGGGRSAELPRHRLATLADRVSRARHELRVPGAERPVDRRFSRRDRTPDPSPHREPRLVPAARCRTSAPEGADELRPLQGPPRGRRG